MSRDGACGFAMVVRRARRGGGADLTADSRGGGRCRLNGGFPRRGCGGLSGCRDAFDLLLFSCLALRRSQYFRHQCSTGSSFRAFRCATRSPGGCRGLCRRADEGIRPYDLDGGFWCPRKVDGLPYPCKRQCFSASQEKRMPFRIPTKGDGFPHPRKMDALAHPCKRPMAFRILRIPVGADAYIGPLHRLPLTSRPAAAKRESEAMRQPPRQGRHHPPWDGSYRNRRRE